MYWYFSWRNSVWELNDWTIFFQDGRNSFFSFSTLLNKILEWLDTVLFTRKRIYLYCFVFSSPSWRYYTFPPRGDWMVVVTSVGSMSVSEQLGTYPSTNPRKVNWYQVRFNVGLKEGRGGKGRGGEGLGAVAWILKLISMCWAVKEDVMWSSAKESELISTISWVLIPKKKL